MKRLVPLVALAALFLGTAAAGRAGDATWPPVLGEQRVLVVLVTWGPQPFTREQVRDMFFRQSDSFFRASSYGRMHLAGDVTPWLTALAGNFGCNQPAIGRVGRAAAASAGYAPDTYDEIVYLHPDVGCAWSGLAQGKEAYLDGELFPKLVEHEFGHTFGLMHANATGCGPTCAVEYGDPYDTMGSGTGDFNPYEKYRLGWLPASGVTWATRKGEYELEQLEVPSARPHAFVVRTAYEDYWVENRRDPARTVDGAVVGQPGVLVRTGDPEGRVTIGVTDYSSYNRLLADPAGRGRPVMAPGDRFALRGAFSLAVVRTVGGRATLRFAWTDRTPPGPVREFRVGEGELVWSDPHETGSGVGSFSVSIDGARAKRVAHDAQGRNATAIPGLGTGTHIARIVAVDRAGNRGRTGVLRFRVDF